MHGGFLLPILWKSSLHCSTADTLPLSTSWGITIPYICNRFVIPSPLVRLESKPLYVYSLEFVVENPFLLLTSL